MTVRDYLRGLDPSGKVFREAEGRLCLAPEERVSPYRGIVDLLDAVPDWEEGTVEEQGVLLRVPRREALEALERIKLRIDPGMEGYNTFVRRPCFRMRGRPVTPERARDIIRRTDSLIGELGSALGWNREEKHPLTRDYFGCINFPQWWFARYHYPTHYGWSHPDGTVGCNGITFKYPKFSYYLKELLGWKLRFPYLDLCIAVSDWDEQPPEWWDAETEEEEERARSSDDVSDEEFCRHLEIGLCTHGDVIEFLAPENAAERYLDYAARFAAPDPELYRSEYYMEKKLLITGEEYLLRCLMDYGLDEGQARTLLKNLPEDMWRDKHRP